MSDWEASTIVTIELPSLDNFPAVLIYTYMCALHARTRPAPKSRCSGGAMLMVFSLSLTRTAPIFVADEVLARDTGPFCDYCKCFRLCTYGSTSSCNSMIELDIDNYAD